MITFSYTVISPVITSQPSSSSVASGGMVTFTVTVPGDGVTYQWFGPNGEALSDIPGKVSGTTTATLQISDVQPGDVGNYRVRVSNAGGSVNSRLVRLSIGEIVALSSVRYLTLFVLYCSITTCC